MSQSLWFIGANEYNECGFTKTKNNTDTESDSDFEDTSRYLTISEWSTKLYNISTIDNGYGFFIFTTTTHKDEFIIYGYIRNCQQLLPHQNNTFYIIPSSIILICLDFFGNNFNKHWVVGFNRYAQCGVGNDQRIIKLTEMIDMKNINKICSGSRGYSLFWINNNGEIYVNGANDYNQLGCRDNLDIIVKPFKCNYFQQIGLKVIDAAAGSCFAIIVCDNGSVWSSGNTSNGENGHGIELQETNKFIQIKALNQVKIINVCIGGTFSLFLDKNGNIWSCGSNASGCLGLAHFEQGIGRLPTKILFFEENHVKIIQINNGVNHCIALSSDGDIYCWGSNKSGQCGIEIIDNTNAEINEPKKVVLETHQNIKEIKCGSYHTGIITVNYIVYLWGSNEYNECCVIREKDDENENIFIPNCINQYVFNITNAKQIIDIALGKQNTLIIVENE